MGLIAFLLAVVVISLLYVDAVVASADFWRHSHNYQHGALLIIVILGILATELATKKPQFAIHKVLLLAAVFAAASVLVVSTVATVLVAQMSFLIILMWLVIASLFGEAEAKRLLLPVALIAFAIPVWDFMIVPLQKMTIIVINYFLDVFRRTSYVEGDYVILRHGIFYVQRGCSGMNFLITGLMLSGLYAYWFLTGWRNQLTAIIAGAVTSVFANWTRVFIIVFIGDMSAMQNKLVHDHIGFGWIVFMLMMGSLLLIGYRFQRVEPGSASNHQSATSANVTDGLSGADDAHTSIRWVRNTSFITLAVALPAVFYALILSLAGPPGPVSIGLPDSVDNAQRTVNVEESVLESHYPEAAAQASAAYLSDGRIVVVDVFAYDLRDKDAELVGYPNRWFDNQQWRTISREEIAGNFKSFIRGPVKFHLESKSESRVAVVGYRVGNAITSSDIEAKAIGTINFFLGVHLGAAFIISMECDGECVSESKTVTKLATSILTGDATRLSAVTE